jgi:hypothetical protein
MIQNHAGEPSTTQCRRTGGRGILVGLVGGELVTWDSWFPGSRRGTNLLTLPRPAQLGAGGPAEEAFRWRTTGTRGEGGEGLIYF